MLVARSHELEAIVVPVVLGQVPPVVIDIVVAISLDRETVLVVLGELDAFSWFEPLERLDLLIYIINLISEVVRVKLGLAAAVNLVVFGLFSFVV